MSDQLQDMKIGVELQAFGKRVNLYVYQDSPAGDSCLVAGPLTYEAVPSGQMLPGPTMTMNMKTAQHLMDELWRCGLRPAEGSGSAGALKATERHLEDMRTLVFNATRTIGN